MRAWSNWSAANPAASKPCHVLAGGNPRALVLLYKVLAQGPEGDVQRDIEQLLDDYTALYKARFEELAPQAQQVVDAMAIHWDPLIAADLDLGRLLERLSRRDHEAAHCYLRAFEIDSSRSWDLDQFLRAGNRLIESGSDLAEILKLAQRARQLAPDHTATQFLAARILALIGKWPPASHIREAVAAKESADFSIGFFRTVVETRHLDEAIAILERTGAKEWWRPIYEALLAARAGTPDQLRTVAPEIRVVATRILREISPTLFREKS